MLAQEKPLHMLAANETFALETIRKLTAAYGGLVVSTSLGVLVDAGHPGELRADIIKAMTEIVRAFPYWLADRARFVAALRGIPIAHLRAAAKHHHSKTWIALMLLLTERFTLILGAGR